MIKNYKKSWTPRIFDWIFNSPKFTLNIVFLTFRYSSKLAISAKAYLGWVFGYFKFRGKVLDFRFLTFSWFLTIFKPKKGFFFGIQPFLIHELCITPFYSVRNENDSWLGYKGSKNGWDTIKRFLLYWKIIRVDFPDACFCIISINCDSFVKTSNFINLRCTGNNHVAILYKNFLTTKIMPKILNDSSIIFCLNYGILRN